MAIGHGLGWRLPSCHGPHIWEAQGPAPLRPHLAGFFLQACWAAQWDPGSHPPLISQCHCRSLHLQTWFSVLRTSHCCFLEEALVVLGGMARWARQKGDGEDGEFPARAAVGGLEQLLRPCRLQTTLWKLKLAFLATSSLSLLCDLGKVLVCLQIWLWGNKTGDKNSELWSKSSGVVTQKGKLKLKRILFRTQGG